MALTGYQSAAAAFEAVPELVENMLLRLPLPDILLAQQVSHSWNSLIKNSPTLQRALFFRPSHDVQLVEVHVTPLYLPYKCKCKRSCLAKKGFLLPRVLPPSAPSPRWASASGDTKKYHISINPFLAAFPWDPLGGFQGALQVSKFPAQVFTGASWRSMLITQPPVKELMVKYYNPRTMWRTQHYHKIKSKPGSPGITFDDIRLHSKGEDYAIYLGKEHLQVVKPTAGRDVVCTAQDVLVELAKNDADGGDN